MLSKEFKKKFDAEANTLKKEAIKGDFLFFMKKMDSIENTALIGALVKVRNLEDLQSLKKIKENSSEKSSSPQKAADYPGGLNSLRQEVVDLLYVDAVYSEEKTIKTDVAFIVEKDGSISNVHAQGNNFTFNRQAEIALYSLAEKFSPAMIQGDPISYRFKLPLTLTMAE
jgi:exosome complex RNA-binding protein Rrp42 (RNase PH superfamily)